MRAGIALGSNVGDRLSQLRRACTEIQDLPSVTPPFCYSSLYETEPIDAAPDAGAFLNAVIEVEFAGQAVTLLEDLQAIEARMGRPSKRPRNASRVIDLDILYVGNLALTNSEIVIPHPRLPMRRFVLQPLHDLRPDLILPGQHRTVAELLAALPPGQRVERLTEVLQE